MCTLLDMSNICCFQFKGSAFHFVPMFAILKKKVQSILKFTCGSLQWVHKHNLSTPQSPHERIPHQVARLYQVVVVGE
jgi:hypothetical protein